MRFTKYQKKKEIANGKKFLAKRYKVDPKYIEFQFEWDVSDFGGGYQLHYEVRDSKHELFGSTISYKMDKK